MAGELVAVVGGGDLLGASSGAPTMGKAQLTISCQRDNSCWLAARSLRCG